MKGIRPEMANHPLTRAAREVNDYSGKYGIHETCEHYDLTVEDVRYLAEQRAMRAIYAFRGVDLMLKEVTVLAFSHEEIGLMNKLTAAYMDGIMIGWRGKEISNE